MSVREMLEAGVHFGHQTHRWDPRMKPYIYGARNGIHIIDLQQTVRMCRAACDFVTRLVAEGGNILFVGTKRQAQSIVEEEAKKAGMFYVSHRWLGGTLTNFRTIRASIERLKDLEKKRNEGGLEGLTKKEKLGVEREIEKLTKALGGIKEMDRLPAALFIIDPHKEAITRMEANRLGIPIVAVADTNCNPEGIDHLIPGNDDAIKSIRLFTAKIAQACLDGLAQRETVMRERLSAQEEEQKTRLREIREARELAGKGRAYVSKPEAYEEKVEGEYKGGQAEKTETEDEES
jgi:small subunit ribosomal protein S2